MNNEPVAWMQSETKELPDGCECMQSVSFFKANDDDIPLYTHPVKELTDEQIFKLAEMLEIKMNHALYAFARTLIKNAQENLECYEKLSDASKMVSKPISKKSRAILRKAQEK
jgi:hypothetical protein